MPTGLPSRPFYFPLSVIIDLGAAHQLTDVYLYDTNGKMDFVVESGKPFDWQPLVKDGLGNFKSWNGHKVDVKTRYLRVVATGQGGGMPEIVLYGSALEPVQKPAIPEPKPMRLPTMDAMIGTNAFIDDPIDKMKAVGYIREYHSWSWDAGNEPYPNNLNAFAPSYAGGGAWNFDDYYKQLKDAGIMVAPTLKGSVRWLDDNHLENKPMDRGDTDATDPKSYEAHADYMFQFAARYGSAKVADEKLKLAPNQPRVSGLNLIQNFENANEPNAHWRDREVYSTPYELAAQTSADYDGHMGTMGDTFGVKNADRNAKLSMGGLAGLQLDYIKSMKMWADWNRKGDFPADILNVHTYSNDLGGQGNSRRGVSPEEDKLREKLAEMVDWRNRYLPGKEFWLTEFGYDTAEGSVQGAPAIGDDDTEEVQGRWLLRSYLAIAAGGVDRAAQYMLRDVVAVKKDVGGKYGTSGLTGVKGDWTPKSSWYYTYTFKSRLTGMRFDGDVASGNENVWIYRFRADDGRGAYVAWCPTSDDRTVDDFALTNLGPATTATLVEFVKGEINGKEQPLNLENRGLTLNVSERPVIVLVDALPPQ
ncbi:MAG TPA: hypothetical protein VGN72_03590 [Tepidisphaeraceae bacterium]|jgi:hypothetical protein|nr:hypothetical protein [Tepidisphaeraceae bacterium]